MLFVLFLAICVSAPPVLHQRAFLEPRMHSDVPDFAIKYAPVTYLYTGENYVPSDLEHTQPEFNFMVITTAPSPLTLHNLNALNACGDSGTYVSHVQGQRYEQSFLACGSGAKQQGQD